MLNMLVDATTITPMKRIKDPFIAILREVESTSSFLYSGSIPNLKVASKMLSKRIGVNKDAVEVIKSSEPYSDVDKTAVYNGTSKNERIFDPKLPIVNNPIFLIKDLFFLSIYSYIPFLICHVIISDYTRTTCCINRVTYNHSAHITN